MLKPDIPQLREGSLHNGRNRHVEGAILRINFGEDTSNYGRVMFLLLRYLIQFWCTCQVVLTGLCAQRQPPAPSLNWKAGSQEERETFQHQPRFTA